MISRICFSRPRLGAVTLPMLVVLGSALAGCAGMSDSMTTAFADPAKYELYDCKQLETERKNLAVRAAELQGLMAKADSGVAGPVVAELAYRNDYVSVRGQARFAEQAWERSKCQPSPPAATPTAQPTGKGAPSRPGRAAR